MPLCLLVILSVFTTCRMSYLFWTHTLYSPCCAINLVQLCSQGYIPIVNSNRSFSYIWRPSVPSCVCVKASAIILLGFFFATSQSFLLYPKRFKESRSDKPVSPHAGSDQGPITPTWQYSNILSCYILT